MSHQTQLRYHGTAWPLQLVADILAIMADELLQLLPSQVGTLLMIELLSIYPFHLGLKMSRGISDFWRVLLSLERWIFQTKPRELLDPNLQDGRVQLQHWAKKLSKRPSTMSWKRGYHPANVLSKAWLSDFIPSLLDDASSWQYMTVLVHRRCEQVDKPPPARVRRNNQVWIEKPASMHRTHSCLEQQLLLPVLPP